MIQTAQIAVSKTTALLPHRLARLLLMYADRLNSEAIPITHEFLAMMLGIISNSEVGLGSVSIAAMLWRLVCLNGARTQDVFRKFHMGRQIEDNADLWADDTKKADDRVVLLKVRDRVTAALDEVRFKVHLEKLQGLADAKLSGKVERAVEVLSLKVGASEAERQGILQNLIKGADLSAWGLVNAVTAQPHTAVSYDRAVEFEGAGGMLLDLAPSAWKEVLEAA